MTSRMFLRARMPGRRLWAGLAALTLAASLVLACSDDEDSGSSSASATGAQPTATASPEGTAITTATQASTGSSSGTRVIEDLTGEVALPANPQRVVAAESVTLGNMLALDFKPIATGVNVNSLPFYLQDKMDGVEDITTAEDIDLERALALGAEMIITFGGPEEDPWNMESCELYAQALPTFCYAYNYVYEEEIKRNLMELGRALNLEDRAEEVLTEYDARVEELKQKVLDTGFTDKPVSVVRIGQNGGYSIRIGTSESIVFRAIGIPQPEGQQNPDDFRIDLSLENLSILNQAYAVIVYVDDNAAADGETVMNSDVWKNLEPVKNGRVVQVNSGVWNSVDILGAMAIMDDIEDLVLPLAEQ
jgi:iron complex transport system substrate-binding protein